jgi:hypothetical protein
MIENPVSGRRFWAPRSALPRRPLATAAVLVVLAFAAGACSSTDSVFGSASGSGAGTGAETGQAGSGRSFRDRLSDFFQGSSGESMSANQQAPAAPGQEEIHCPIVDVRTGASTLSITAPGADPGATAIRYQASIAQLARECAALGATMTIKVGVEGRIILGPAGGPGQLEAPIRIALVHEGPEPKTIWTKLYRIPVTIPPGQNRVSFVHVEEDLTFPMPKAEDLTSYIIYVGYDEQGLKERRGTARRR